MLILSVALIALTGCFAGIIPTPDEIGEKQIPVYQGMSITKAPQASQTAMLLGPDNDDFDYDKDNGNHNGHFKGDHTDRDEEIDEEKPFPENGENENIEEEIKSSLDVIGSPDTIYYATPGEDIYINIHIDNPDSFEIMSFTLNGKKYSSYMFEDGSDMETIVLKYNVGTASGIVEYTIDAIKYVDGTEIKDVLIDGDKTVRAGIMTEGQVQANLSDIDIDTNALSFKVSIKDNDGLIAYSDGVLKAVLYDGFEIVAEKDLAPGENAVAFDSLQTSTLYQYAVVAYYDDLSGDGFKMNVLYKDAFYTDAVVLFDNITVGQDNVSFSLLWHEDHTEKSVSALKLYQNDRLINTLDVNAASVEKLLSDNTYKLVAEYTNGVLTESIYLEFTTFAKATPEISVINPTQTQTSVGFEISETDADNVGAITKIELVHANGTVVADSLDQRAFANLLSDNAYTVKVTYVYDLNDGAGVHTVTDEFTITTDAKAAPSFTVKNANVTAESITAEYDISDVDNLLSYYKIELYEAGTLVLESTDKKINFEDLAYYTDHTVRFTYRFDLNDGNGEQSATYDYTFKTLPYIDVTDCSIANTSAVSEGDTIFMSVTLDNPLGMSIESVVINGETYAVTGASTNNRIFVEIVYNGQFAGGDTYLKIDKVNAKIGTTALNIEPKSELSDNVFINGKFDVLGIGFVNEDFEPIDWAFPSQKVYVMITLDNATGYRIDSIKESGSKSQGTVTSLMKLDNNHWYYEVNLIEWANGEPFYDTSFDTIGFFNRTLESLSYSNDYLAKTVTFSGMKASFYRLRSDTVNYITCPEDIESMYNGNYYALANDIDLAGIEWHGKEFEGVLDGKGYSIKNMSFVGTIKNTSVHLGLFSTVNGVIQNLNMERVTIIADVTADDGNKYDVYCGALAAFSPYQLNIIGCTVDEYSVISVKSTNKDSTFVGGLVGYIYSGVSITIADSTNSGSVSSNCDYVGGLAGYITTSDSPVMITGCTNAGNVSGNDYVGGLLGYVADYHFSIRITDCTNTGKVSGNDLVGGLVGMAYSTASILITGNTNTGSVSGNGSVGGLLGVVNSAFSTVITGSTNVGSVSGNDNVGGLVGCADYTITITNCANSGSIFGSYATGGFIGGAAHAVAITGSTNSGTVSGGNSTGGFLGHIHFYDEFNFSFTITDCTNTGSVSGDVNVGHLVGYSYSQPQITNSYSLEGLDYYEGYNGDTCTTEQLNSKEFYTDTLSWSEDIWDLSELDIENGKCPTIKNA